MKSTIRQTVHKMAGLGVVAKAVLGASLVLGGAPPWQQLAPQPAKTGTSPVSSTASATPTAMPTATDDADGVTPTMTSSAAPTTEDDANEDAGDDHGVDNS